MRTVWVISEMTDCEGGFPIGVASALGIAQVMAEKDAHDGGRNLTHWREGPEETWSADVPDRTTFYEIRKFTINA